jgi:tetratricopeptide (TPR) repeat protein
MHPKFSRGGALRRVLFLGSMLALFHIASVNGQEKPVGSRDEQRGGVIVRVKGEKGQTESLYDESHALIVGVSDYTNGWGDLTGVVSDVAAVGSVLKNQGFNVRPVLNPTHELFDRELRDFISEYGQKERNRVLIYYAGHGYTEELRDGRDMSYLVPADAPPPEDDPRLFNRRAISMDEIEALAKKIKAKHALFVFDSCFSGSIFEVRGSSRTPVGIESSTAAPVRQFITAGTKNQTVPAQSIFRVYFVRAFEKREGDMNRDGYITGEELGNYLAGQVAKESYDAQTPRHGKINNVYLNQGDFVFKLPSLSGQPDSAIPVSSEESFWASIAGGNDRRAFEAYWSAYCAGGVHCAQALDQLRLLEAKPAPSQSPAPGTPERREAWAAKNQADQYRVSGAFEAAIAELGKAIRLDPGYADAYVSRGHVYSQMGNHKRAIADYSEAIRIDPNNKGTLQSRGYSYAQSGDNGKAVEDYTRAIALAPNDFMLFHNRGAAYLNNGDYRKAITDFSETINLNDRYVEAYRNRAYVYHIIGKKELAIADENAARKLAEQ